MEASLRQLVAALAVAMIVAIAARRLKLPYTVGLVVVGIGVAVSRSGLGLPLTHDFVFDLILPPLLFDAALSLAWRELWRDIIPIFALSTLGTVIAAAAVTSGMVCLVGWPLPAALMFGVLIAATDPVAIIAMFKDNGVKGRIRLLVESESLFNDGAAAVLFVMALAWTEASAAAGDALQTAETLAQIVLGGAAIGAACGFAAILVARRTTEHLIEAALTTVVAYGSFLLAEYFHVSGVLAAVAAGLVMGNLGVLSEQDGGVFSSKGREFVLGFWEFAAFLANSAIFLLIGTNVAAMPFQSYGVEVLLASIAIVLAGRVLTVYPVSLLFFWSRWKISWSEQHVLCWGGLRGALALALSLSLPPTLPLRDEIVVVTFGVVAFSIVVQGLTMPWLLRWLGFLPPPA